MEKIYLSDNIGNKYLYHKIKKNENIDNSLKEILPEKTSLKEIILHWSGGSHTHAHLEYQINVGVDFIAVADKSHIDNGGIHPHLWRRNTGKWAVSFLGMYDIKKYPITKDMIENAIKVITFICDRYNLNPTTNFFDHHHYAVIDKYSDRRWDANLIMDWGNGKKESLTSYIRNRVIDALKIKTTNSKTPVISLESKPADIPTKYITKSEFFDVKTTDWFSYQTNFVKRLGLMTGDKITEATFKFYPEKNITRKEIASVFKRLIEYLEKKTGKTLPDIKNMLVGYNDVGVKDWFYKDVMDLSEKGILTGYNLNNSVYFKPEQELTRAEFCTLLCSFLRYLEKQNIIKTKLEDPTVLNEIFLDITKKHWAWQNINTCVDLNILVGYKTETGSYFKPDNKVKRNECAVGLYKLIKYLVEIKVIIETL